MSDKTGWGGRGQQLRTHIATVWILAQALGPAKEHKYTLESPKGYTVWDCWELKTEMSDNRERDEQQPTGDSTP